MHTHHLTHRISRFTRSRHIDVDSRALYWCTVTILVFVAGLTSIKPVSQATIPIPYPVAQTLNTQQHSGNGRLASSHSRVHSQLLTADGNKATPQTSPRVLRIGNAIYPGAAIRAGLEGHVVVQFVVNRDGSISYPQVLTSNPQGVFDTAALRAVRATRFAPFYAQHHPTSLPLDQPRTQTLQRSFAFRLNNTLINAVDAQTTAQTTGE